MRPRLLGSQSGDVPIAPSPFQSPHPCQAGQVADNQLLVDGEILGRHTNVLGLCASCTR